MSKFTSADVEAMDENDLYDLLSRVQEEIKRREEGGFASIVRAYLEEEADAELRAEVVAGGGAARLEFRTEHWDNGWFYNGSSGEFVLHNGDRVEVDLDDTAVDEALTELSAIRRSEYDLDRYSIVVVNLKTGEVEHDVRL